MIRSIWRFSWHVILFVAAGMLTNCGHHCAAADAAKIQQAISKAQAYIIKQRLTGAHGSIAALGYIKSGGDRNAPPIQEILREVLQKFQNGAYRPSQHHNYEAGVDLMLLEATDEKLFRPQMEACVAYLLSTQQPNGAWYYPTGVEPDCGDTSITQYAVMGLWAAQRAGIEIPIEVLEKIARWHISKQKSDGGFCYHPFETHLPAHPEAKTTVGTMTAAGSSNLLIIRQMLFGNVALNADIRPTETKRRFGVLEKFVDDKGGGGVKREVTMRVTQIDESLKESIRWMTTNFGAKSSNHETWFCYDFYCIERVAALMDVATFGDHNWYDEGANELLTRQAKDGAWTDQCNGISSTALGLMFLSKVTATIVKPQSRTKLLGGGLQAGGRGLPDNLDAVEVKDGTVAARKIVGAVDNLLIELERSSDAKVMDVQAAVVDAIQLDRSEELIGQVDRLKKLASDSRLEVRRTAFWALGRSGNVSAVPSLILGLSDADISVAREASLALCILSRRPEGCGKAIDPTDDTQMGIKDDATDEQRKLVVEAWQKESTKRWTDWYQKYRSYDDRDDKTTLKRTNR